MGYKATVCQMCGDKGEEPLLIDCAKCGDCAVHQYCIERFSIDDEYVTWMCEECEPNNTKLSPSRKSERIRVKKEQEVEVRMDWKNKQKRERSPLISERTVFIRDEMVETPKLHITKLSPSRKSEGMHVEKEQDFDVLANWKNKQKRGRSPLIRDRTVFIKDEMVEAPKSTSDCPLPHEEIMDMDAVDETFGKQVLKNRRKLIIDEESIEDDFESVKAEASFLESYGQPFLESDNYVRFGKENLTKRKRRLFLIDKDSSEDELKSDISEASYGHYGALDASYSQPFRESDIYFHAQPVIDPIWRGSYNITNGKYKFNVQLMVHLSSKACSKVSTVASSLPRVLDVTILPKSDVWPKSFKTTHPTDDNIALYVFPKSERDEKVFDCLLDTMMEHNLALKALIDDAELLVFSSLELPQEHWRFRRKYYMWGVFRPKQHCTVPAPMLCQAAALPKHMMQAVRQGAKGLVRTMSTPSAKSPLSTSCRHVHNPSDSTLHRDAHLRGRN